MNQQEDLKLLKKAKRRVMALLIASYICMCLYSLAVYSLLSQPLFSRPEHFNMLYIGSLVIQVALWLIVFFYLSSGDTFSRTVYWIGTIVEALFCGYLFYDAINHPDQIWVYLVWIFAVLIRIVFLLYIGRWLSHSYWAKIFFDKVVVIYGKRPEQKPVPSTLYRQKQQAVQPSRATTAQPRQVYPSAASSLKNTGSPQRPSNVSSNVADSSGTEGPGSAVYMDQAPDFQTEAATVYKKEKQRASGRYPHAAIRIGLWVYGEMIVFPMIVHLFEGSFVSVDNQSVFAMSLMFTLCILTAALWTVPLFFIYLKQPGLKKSVWFGLAAQVLVICFGAFMLFEYAHSSTTTWSWLVFARFIGLEAIRYALLLYAIYPVFSLSEIDSDDEDDEDEDMEEDEETQSADASTTDISNQ